MSPLISLWHPSSPSPSLYHISQNSKEPQVPAVITQTVLGERHLPAPGSGCDRDAALPSQPCLCLSSPSFFLKWSLLDRILQAFYLFFFSPPSMVLLFSISMHCTSLCAFAVLILFTSPSLITTQFYFYFLIYILLGFFLTFSLPLIALSNALCSFSLSLIFLYDFIFPKPMHFPFSSVYPVFIISIFLLHLVILQFVFVVNVNISIF